jgi:predicted transcriptional regulator
MRLHIEIDDELVRAVDRLAGSRRRSAFIREAIETALSQQQRLERLRAARGSIRADGHEWDDDPAGWVAAQRRSDARRVG